MSSTTGIPDETPPPRSPSAYSSFSSDHISLIGEVQTAQPGPATPPQRSATLEERNKEAVKTPIQFSVSTHQVAPKERNYETMMSHEMSSCCHEMPYDDFMFLCANTTAFKDKIPGLFTKALKKMSKFKGLGKCTSEAQMYEHLCEGFNSALNAAKKHAPTGRSYVFKNTSGFPETATDDMKPDLSMYPDDDAARQAFRHDIDYENVTESTARTAWGWMSVAAEVKFQESRSAFGFGGKQEFLRKGGDGREAQAQLAKYAAQILFRQHRVSTFLIYVCKTKARLTRWDRTGCIVSTPIDLEKEPAKLLSFIFRLGLMSPKELGYDETAVLATSSEIRELNNIHHVNKYASERAEEILRPETRMFHPIYKITRGGGDGKGERRYFIGKHSVATYSITGRATKGYVVFILRNDGQSKSRLGFLKDYWRPLSQRITPEVEIYEKLHKVGVQHIATVICGGDIESGTQLTKTDDYLKKRPHAPLKRAHCFIIFEELARPLKDYENSKELIIIVYHALLGHEDAWTKAEILHRDISSSNIMFVVDQSQETTVEPYGILNDWDLCKLKSQLNTERTQSGRSGTWAFMSGGSLRWPLKPYQLSDDIEAFVHVITFFCLRYHWHSRTSMPLCNHAKNGTIPDEKELYDINGRNVKLGSYVATYYDACDPGHLNGIGINTGGQEKTELATSGNFSWRFLRGCTSQPLVELVQKLGTLLQAHYAELDLDAMDIEFSGCKEFALQPRRAVNPNPGRLLASDGPSGATQQAQEVSAPTTDVSVSACKNGALDFHSRIKAVFEETIAAIQVPEASFQDKTPDQFLGLREFHDAPPRGPSGSRPVTTTRTASSLQASQTIPEDTRQDSQQDIHADAQSPPVKTRRPKRPRQNTQVDLRRSKRSRKGGRAL